MGCTNSTPGEGPGPRPAQSQRATSLTVPVCSYARNADWGQSVEGVWKQVTDSGERKEFSAGFQNFIIGHTLNWLKKAEPACARAGTIEDMGETTVCTSYGKCKYPTRTFLTLDDNFTGVVYSLTLVIAAPLEGEGDDQPLLTPGASLKTVEMKAAMEHMPRLLHEMQKNGVNVNHARINVVMGADFATCKFLPATAEPTIKDLEWSHTDGFKKNNNSLAKLAQGGKSTGIPPFLPFMFNFILDGADHFPGSTVWDEGELDLSVNGSPYPHPTRILSVRSHEIMSEDVEATIFSIESPVSDDKAQPKKLLRNQNPGKDPGGVVALFLIIADPTVLWPKSGAYEKHPAFRAAQTALVEKMRKLYKSGKTQRCTGRVFMGADMSQHKLVGDPLDQVKVKDQLKDEEASAEEPVEIKAHLTGLEAFSVTLKEQPKHQLFDSESHFQAIKQRMNERAAENPDSFNQMAPMVSAMAAKHLLQMNFPACEISDEGEFPATLPDGTAMQLADTRLIVARDPKQEPKSIVAVVHVVPSPKPGMGWRAREQNWLDTPEMKGAEYALLTLLKQLYAEGKVSEVDCMAQVMMGIDASIYQFVEGSKFVDYSDERMAQWQWG